MVNANVKSVGKIRRTKILDIRRRPFSPFPDHMTPVPNSFFTFDRAVAPSRGHPHLYFYL